MWLVVQCNRSSFKAGTKFSIPQVLQKSFSVSLDESWIENDCVISLIPTCSKNCKNRFFFYDFPTSGILTISGNTAPQTPRRSATFTTWSERSIPDSPWRWWFLRWVWTWNLPVWDIGDAWCCCFLLPKLDVQWIIDYKCTTLSTAVKL